MKRLIIVMVSIILSATYTCAQKMPQDYFNEAVQYEEAGKHDAAIDHYNYIIKHHPRNKIYINAVYNLADVLAQKKDYQQAIIMYQKVLSSPFDDKTPVQHDIMASPFANLKHYSGMGIYEAYSSLGQYDSALVYLNKANNINSYEHFCGNAQASKDIYMSLRYAELFDHLKDSINSEKALLKTVFHESEGNGEIVEKLVSRYKQTGYKQLAAVFDRAVDSLKAAPDREYPNVIIYSIFFRNTEIIIPDLFYMSAEEPDKATIQKELKGSYFRGMLELL